MAITVTRSFTGRHGHITVDATELPITKWSAKLTRELADATDSNNYNPDDGQTWKSQQPGVIGIEGTIEGNFDLDSTADLIIAKFKVDAAFPCVLGLTRTTNLCTGNFDFNDTDISLEVPGSSMVTWTTTFKSSGVLTLFAGTP